MKKIISIILVAMMLTTMVIVAIPSSAAGNVTVNMTGSVKDPMNGEASVTLTFKVTSNPGINTLTLNVGYNAETLVLDSVTNGAVFPESGLTVANTAANPLVIKLDNGSTDATGTGVIVKVKFLIADQYGKFDFTTSVDNNGTSSTSGALNGSVSTTFSTNTQHNYLALPTTVPATCTEDGYTEKRCNLCGAILEHVITEEAPGHDYELVDSVSPTCTEDGYEEYECTVCGDVNTVVIPASHTAGEAVIVDATETEAGSKTISCTVCGTIISEEVIPATGTNTEPANEEDPTEEPQQNNTNTSTETKPTTEEKTEPTEDIEKNPTKNPQTGDKLVMIIALIVVSLLIIAFIYYIGKNDIKLADMKCCKIKNLFAKKEKSEDEE